MAARRNGKTHSKKTSERERENEGNQQASNIDDGLMLMRWNEDRQSFRFTKFNFLLLFSSLLLLGDICRSHWGRCWIIARRAIVLSQARHWLLHAVWTRSFVNFEKISYISCCFPPLSLTDTDFDILKPIIIHRREWRKNSWNSPCLPTISATCSELGTMTRRERERDGLIQTIQNSLCKFNVLTTLSHVLWLLAIIKARATERAKAEHWREGI